MDYQTIKISPQFRIEVLDSPRGFELSDYDKTRVEMVWREETDAQASKLFNGQILNFVSLDENKMVGEFVDYKFFFAQLKDPGLDLKIVPICVSGVTLSGDKVLIGKRSQTVTQFRGYYECVPSGGIDAGLLRSGTINLQEQFSRELWEETGISVTEIKRIHPFQIVHDLSSRHYEVCALIDVNYMVVHDPREPTEEYSEFSWVPKSELKSFLKKHEGEFVPFSVHLLNLIRI